MKDQNRLRDWTIFGPIPNPGSYPGEKGWNALPPDAAGIIPDEIAVDGRTYKAIHHKVSADVCRLDFRPIFKSRLEGSPMCYAFCKFTVKKDSRVVFSADCDWGMVLWLDGGEILHARDGNGYMGAFSRRTRLTLSAGAHVLACRIIAGSQGWKLGLDIREQAGNLTLPRYSDTGLRIEERSVPSGRIGEFSMEVYERTLAACGVESRWIGVSDQSHVRLTGNALYKSAFLPLAPNYEDGFEENFKKWVKFLHDLGEPVLSWIPMTQCRQGWLDHPEWRQKYQVEPGPDSDNKGMACCINSPFGEALANFCAEAVVKFDLDGIWFDGSAFTPIWEVSQPVGCWCDYCRDKYKKETGAELPTTFTPETLEFRKWMAWRYKNFADYIQSTAGTIKKAKPAAEVVVNHYHRENIGWNGAIPLNPFTADIVSGIEADGDQWKGAFYTRLMRAYGKPQTEVWLAASVGMYQIDGQWRHNPRYLLTHAIGCLTAGGNPSYGGINPAVSARVLTGLAQEINPRKPYRYLPSVPFAAMLVSQQTDTFTFGTNPAFVQAGWQDHYWNSLAGWDRLLMQAGVWTDVLFDDHLKKDRLARYQYIVLPFAVALSDSQVKALLDYVKNGGTLVTGPCFATQDEWGFARKRSSDLEKLFPSGSEFPQFDRLAEFFEKSGTKSSTGKFGKGKIVQYAADIGGDFRVRPSFNLVREVWTLINRDKGGIPIVLEGQGKDVFVHLGVFKEKGGATIVAIQQVPSFRQVPDADTEAPLTAAGCRLKVYLPGVRHAESVLSTPSVALNVKSKGKYKEIELPPFTWGLTLRLS
jgi:hypothetical protein